MIKFQTETTDISRNIGIEMGKKQYGFTDIDRFDHRVDRNDRIFNFGGNGWDPAKDGYFRCVRPRRDDGSRRRDHPRCDFGEDTERICEADLCRSGSDFCISAISLTFY